MLFAGAASCGAYLADMSARWEYHRVKTRWMMLGASALTLWVAFVSVASGVPAPRAHSWETGPGPSWPVWIELAGQPCVIDQPRRPQTGPTPEPRRSGALGAYEFQLMARAAGPWALASKRAPGSCAARGAHHPRAPPSR